MMNWAVVNGSGTSRSGQLFMSKTTTAWRVEMYGYSTDTEGVDGNGAYTDLNAWDCYFGDFDFALNNTNGRQDTGIGFGLLNCKGCTYPDATTTCRMIFRD